jgi:hypothetical protein
MNPLQKHFLRRITVLRGARNLAVQMRTASASALRAPCTSPTPNTFSKDSSCAYQLKP